MHLVTVPLWGKELGDLHPTVMCHWVKVTLGALTSGASGLPLKRLRKCCTRLEALKCGAQERVSGHWAIRPIPGLPLHSKC